MKMGPENLANVKGIRETALFGQLSYGATKQSVSVPKRALACPTLGPYYAPISNRMQACADSAEHLAASAVFSHERT